MTAAVLAPMRAVTGTLPADDEHWAFEVKWDGHRTLAVIDGEGLRLLSANGHDVTARYPELAGLPGAVAAGAAVLDGEVVVLDDDGVPRFELVQRHDRPAVFVVFDLLALDGRDTVGLGFEERRALLAAVVAPGPAWVVGTWQRGDGPALFDATRARGLEGVMAKRLGSTYQPGRRSPAWRKIKHRARQELVVGGWTAGTGARTATFGALLVGYHHHPGDTVLAYAGAVGTGFDDATLADLAAVLGGLVSDECPFDPPPPRPVRRTARWCRPVLVAEVAFTEWTADGRLRQPSFTGLRTDKDPAEVVRE